MALPIEDRCLWWTAALAGLRRGELRGLRWSDVDLEANVIVVERSWDEKEGPVPPKSPRAGAGCRSRLRCADTCSSTRPAAGAAARSSCSGGPARSLERIGDYVGHSSAYMTDAYRHLLDGHEAQAAERFEDYLTRAANSTPTA